MDGLISHEEEMTCSQFCYFANNYKKKKHLRESIENHFVDPIELDIYKTEQYSIKTNRDKLAYGRLAVTTYYW